MAKNEIDIAASPEDVFEVLADPAAYGYWVVGSSEIRDSDSNWPEPGSRFRHRIGWGPFKVGDYTRVEQCERPHVLILHAKARPFGTAVVIMQLQERDGGTHVTMVEDPGDSFTALLFTPITHALTHLRNNTSLQRLKQLAERQAQAPGQAQAERKKHARA